MDELNPIYRIEFFLDAIVNNTTPPDPIYRAEFYLAKIAGANVEIPEPVYRMEKYLAYLCGEEVELPDPIYRIEYYLAFLCGLNVELPEPIYRVEFWLWDWCGGGGIEKTVTGNPIHITDALAKPAQALSIALEPIQDLHGYDNPWPSGGGVNVVDFESVFTEGWTNETGGLKATYSKGYITITGTNETAGWVNIVSFTTQWSDNPLVLPAGSYTNPSNLRLVSSADDGPYTNKTGTITVTDSLKIRGFYIAVYTGQTVNWTIPMVVARGTTEPTTFSPYSNICPITGWQSVEVWRTGKNLLDTSSFASGLYNDVTLTKNADGSISLSGTASSTVNIHGTTFTLPAGTYTLSGSISNSQLYLYDHTANTVIVENVNGVTRTITTTEDKTVYLRLRVGSGSTVSGTVKPQLEVGSASSYEPYQGETYTIDLGTTVYGGTLDVTTGKLTVDRAMVDLGMLNWGYNSSYGFYATKPADMKGFAVNVVANILCSIYPTKTYGDVVSGNHNHSIGLASSTLAVADTDYTSASDFKTAMDGVQLVYELAEPITYDLTPTEITLLLGENNLWSDAGDMTLTYYADGNASDIEALNILLGGRYVNNHGEDEPTDREALNILLGGNR